MSIPVISYPGTKAEAEQLSSDDQLLVAKGIIKVHKAVIASGARYSGPTIHFVDVNYDTGRTLAQAIVPVLANDTEEDLAARVLRQEHKMYVEVVEALYEERITWREDGVPLIHSKSNPNHYS